MYCSPVVKIDIKTCDATALAHTMHRFSTKARLLDDKFIEKVPKTLKSASANAASLPTHSQNANALRAQALYHTSGTEHNQLTIPTIHHQSNPVSPSNMATSSWSRGQERSSVTIFVGEKALPDRPSPGHQFDSHRKPVSQRKKEALVSPGS
ncbi:hypothetical protein T440DRAFT_482125 [Plenodomus tracheiphilus IPT5]|uniref:Uncharacterized protein n=1 Tax=Plenodomus tracheiphilus IPT5 TaxID=1408161 RepID=A0A6A7AUU4_9PLEO|nr:hypothetical protein T440DRAFT_482125 [Plenodomus tracheiphilus IPT5]